MADNIGRAERGGGFRRGNDNNFPGGPRGPRQGGDGQVNQERQRPVFQDRQRPVFQDRKPQEQNFPRNQNGRIPGGGRTRNEPPIIRSEPPVTRNDEQRTPRWQGRDNGRIPGGGRTRNEPPIIRNEPPITRNDEQRTPRWQGRDNGRTRTNDNRPWQGPQPGRVEPNTNPYRRREQTDYRQRRDNPYQRRDDYRQDNNSYRGQNDYRNRRNDDRGNYRRDDYRQDGSIFEQGGRGRFQKHFRPKFFERDGRRYDYWKPRFNDYLPWLGGRGRGFHQRIRQFCDVDRGFYNFNNRYYGVGYNNQWYPINTGFCRGANGLNVPYFVDSGFYVDQQGIVYADSPQGLVEVAAQQDQYGYYVYGANGEVIRIQPQPLDQGNYGNDYGYNQPNYVGGSYNNGNVNINGGVSWGNGNWGAYGGYNQNYYG